MKKVVILVTFIAALISCFLYIAYPRITLKGSKEVEINVGEKYIEEGAYSKNIFSNNKVAITNNINIDKIGTYKVIYKTKFLFFKNSAIRNVKVIDKESPIIKLIGEDTVSVCKISAYKEQGYTATDNYDGDITDKVTSSSDKHGVITYMVKDSSFNEIKITRKLIEEDKEKPTITLKGSSTEYLYVGSIYEDSGYTASDNCDGNITDKVKKTGAVNTKKSGTYSIKYSVIDNANNETSVIRKVIVKEKSTTKYNSVYKSGTIYLTFDDGPSNSTVQVLDILKKYNVKATFFVINTDSKYDYLIKRAHNEGHTVAIHGYSHNYKTIYSSVDAFMNNINKMNSKIKKLTGQESKILRFPGGSSNTVSKNYSKGIMTTLTNKVLEDGYVYFDWNVGSSDTSNISSTKIYNNVIKGLSKDKINIVLLHDYANHTTTVNALANIINYGLKNGYTFERITTQTPMITHKVVN